MNFSQQAQNVYKIVVECIQIIRYEPKKLLWFLLGFGLLFIRQLPLPENISVFTKQLFQWLPILSVILIGNGIWRIWKQAIPPQDEEISEVYPSAIKGPMPFLPQDGKLFSRLGREMELRLLLNWVVNDQNPIVVIMGESGAGKSSLLRAGLEYTLSTNDSPYGITPIYWEATPTNSITGLFYAVQSRCPEESKIMNSLNDLIEIKKQSKKVIIIDQAEQLSPEKNPEIFGLLTKAIQQPPPYLINWVIAFRREYDPVWRDFELTFPNFHPPMLSLKLFSLNQAHRNMATLVDEGNLKLEDNVLTAMLNSMAEHGKVSPVDIGIGMLVINEAASINSSTFSTEDYQNAGKVEGILGVYINKHLERLPEFERSVMLSIFLEMVEEEDPHQRRAGGRKILELEKISHLPIQRLRANLAYFSSAYVRLLEPIPPPPNSPQAYRLSHEKLIPSIRRVSGIILAEADQALILLNRRYNIWQKERKKRFLLSIEELSLVLKYKNQISLGKNNENKWEFIRKSKARRNLLYLVRTTLVFAIIGFSIVFYKYQKDQIHRNDLIAWGLPGELYEFQQQLDTLTISCPDMNKLDWLNKGIKKFKLLKSNLNSTENIDLPSSLEKIHLKFGHGFSNLKGLTVPGNIREATLDFSQTRVRSLEGLRFNENLTQLTLEFMYNNIYSFEGINLPNYLTQLTINLNETYISNWKGLRLPENLTFLDLIVNETELHDWEALKLPQNLSYLNLKMSETYISNWKGLILPENLSHLNMQFGLTEIVSWDGLNLPIHLSKLSIDLYRQRINSWYGLNLPKNLIQIELDLARTNISSWEGLVLPQNLSQLSIDLSSTKIDSWEGLVLPQNLSQLAFDQFYKQSINTWDGLVLPQNLSKLSFVFYDQSITSWEGLTLPQNLSQLSVNFGSETRFGWKELTIPPNLTVLNLISRNNSDLDGLNLPQNLSELSLKLEATSISKLKELHIPQNLTQFTLILNRLYSNNSSWEGVNLPFNLSQLDLTYHWTSLSMKNNSWEGIKLPPNLSHLSLKSRNSRILNWEESLFPDTIPLKTLKVNASKVYNIEKLPKSIKSLYLEVE